MSYCLAVAVDDGMVFCSDSRTIEGVDRVSTYGKMFQFGSDGQRQFVILASGNLATAQATIARVKLDIQDNAARNLMRVATVQEAADYLGDLSLTEQQRHGESDGMEASFIIGGQIAGSDHEVALVYPQGNHITTLRTPCSCRLARVNTASPSWIVFLRQIPALIPALCARWCPWILLSAVI